MDRMSALDAGFFFAESENTPMHVGSVAVFDGPGPHLRRRRPAAAEQAAAGAPLPPARARRCRCSSAGRCGSTTRTSRSCTTCGTPRCPRPGSDEQLRNLAGRVLGQRLDMAKPLWELWLVEGLADDRWAIISKVHHCMVDGVAGTDLMQLMFDLEPDATHEAPKDWTPRRSPSSLVAGRRRRRRRAWPTRCGSWPRCPASAARAGRQGARRRRARPSASTVPSLAKQAVTPTARSLNGPIGPHRRWAWTDGKFEEFKAVRTALGGTVNDVVLDRDHRRLPRPAAGPRRAVLGEARRPLDGAGVGPPADQKGSLNNQVSAVFVDLPVGARRPGRPAGGDPRADGRVQEDDEARRRQLDHRAWATTSRPTLLVAGRPGRRCRPARCLVPGGHHERARARGSRSTCSAGGWSRRTPTCPSPAARAARSASSPT